MVDNSGMLNAKRQKFDEYFTLYGSISDEMGHYRQHFDGQVVYCNCDDPATSNFWRYFHSNFGSLKLKRLISTHYRRDAEPSYAMIYDGGDDFNMDAGKIVEIKGNSATVNGKEVFYTAGDFRSEVCIKLLEESTIVVTNPPFSLFREYIAQILSHKKKFVIIGNMSAITNKDIFPLIRENNVWTGYKRFGGGMDMIVPSSVFDETKVKNYRIDENGNRIVNVMGVIWYTNIETIKRRNGLWHVNGKFDNTQAHCYYEGNEQSYPKYDNYDAIDIGKELPSGKRVGDVSLVPIDYDGVMGVPITWLDKFNPDEFDIVWQASGNTRKCCPADILTNLGYIKNDADKGGCAVLNGERLYSRIFIRNLHPIKKADDRGY